MGSPGDAGLSPPHPPPSWSPSYSSRALDSRLGRSGLFSFPLCPFSCIALISASNYVPRACSKVPSSKLPWGGSGDRVRLVNSAGVLRGWEGTLGTEAQRSHTQGGHGKGPARWPPPWLLCLLWVFLRASASSFLLLLLLHLGLTVGPAPYVWWK